MIYQWLLQSVYQSDVAETLIHVHNTERVMAAAPVELSQLPQEEPHLGLVLHMVDHFRFLRIHLFVM